jgi:hypothetical protein
LSISAWQILRRRQESTLAAMHVLSVVFERNAKRQSEFSLPLINLKSNVKPLLMVKTTHAHFPALNLRNFASIFSESACHQLNRFSRTQT